MDPVVYRRRINLTECIDLIDDCNWGVWVCEYEMPDGTWRTGEVQSDGYEIARETLVDENGDPV